MDLDELLDRSAPRTAHVTPPKDHELAELVAESGGSKAGRLGGRRTLAVAIAALIGLGGVSAAAAAPGIIGFIGDVISDRTTQHRFTVDDGSVCAIEWAIGLAEGRSAEGSEPALAAAREYLLALDISAVVIDPDILQGIRDGEASAEGPARSEADIQSVALMSTVARLLHAELERQGYGEAGVVLQTMSYDPASWDACR